MSKIFLLVSLIITLLGCPSTTITEPPTITLLGRETVQIFVHSTWTEIGFDATDHTGADISKKVTIDTSTLNTNIVGTYQIIYDVIDNYGGKAIPVIRTVIVSEEFGPTIILNGENPHLIGLRTVYADEEKGAIATSNEGVDLTPNIVIDSTAVNSNEVGTYNVIYTVKDLAGIEAQVIRYVTVMTPDTPIITVLGDGQTAEDPFILPFDTTLESSDLQRAYLYSRLPKVQAFDLKDGDITYKVDIVSISQPEDSGLGITDLLAAIAAASDEASIYKVHYTVTDTDNNKGQSTRFIKLTNDVTAPQLRYTGSPNEYNLEVNVWETNLVEYNTLIDKIEREIEVCDDKDTNNGWMPLPVHGMTLTRNDSALNAMLERPADETDAQARSRFPATQNERSFTVRWTLSDSSKNTTSYLKTFILVDTTPPVFINDGFSNIDVVYGATNLPTLQYRDNSGLIGNATPTGLSEEDFAIDTRTVGVYSDIDFTVSDYNDNNVKKQITMTVAKPVAPQLPNNLMNGTAGDEQGRWTYTGTLVQHGSGYFGSGYYIKQDAFELEHWGVQMVYRTSEFSASSGSCITLDGFFRGSDYHLKYTFGTLTSGASDATYFAGVTYNLTYQTARVDGKGGRSSHNPTNTAEVIMKYKKNSETDSATAESYTNLQQNARNNVTWITKTLDFTPTSDATIQFKYHHRYPNLEGSEFNSTDGNAIDDIIITATDWPVVSP